MRQIGQGVPDLRSDKQANKTDFIYIDMRFIKV